MTCHTCQGEAFLHCSLCRVAYCVEHKCEHLGDFEESYTYEETDRPTREVICETSERERRRHWLSYANILGDMSESKLREALARYKLLIKQIEEELVYRSISSEQVPRQITRRSLQNQTDYSDQGTRSSKGNNKIAKIARLILVLPKAQQRLIIEKLEALKNG